jgi:triacylglycerol lipase
VKRALTILAVVAAIAATMLLSPADAGAAKGGGGKPPKTTTTTSPTTTSTSTTSTTTSSTSTTVATPPARDPIVFVHGWNSSGAIWSTMISRFEADGWAPGDLYAWSYDYNQSNATTAQQLGAFITNVVLPEHPGATKVDLVSHSMGGLSTRWYVKFASGGLDHVDEWVSLGGPNHGTDTAYFCFSTACSEMRPGSSLLSQLNSGDETPGAVHYGTWWSPCDNVINPDSSVALTGATNTQTACLGHSDLYVDATVYGQVRDFVR